METLSLLIIALAVLAFGLLSRRLDGTVLTPAMVFVGLGWVAHRWGGLELELGEGPVHLLAELTLVLVLFTDASRIDLRLLQREHDLPLRLLVVGLPLTVLTGTLAALWLLPHLGLWEAALLAAILAPTDAALGQAVIGHRAVPIRIRQALNVESGLNDGLALPLVLLLLSVACAVGEPAGPGYWIRFGALQLTVGPAVGVAAALAGGRAVDAARRRRWMTDAFQDLAILALALLAFAAAELLGGNGFISAFCAGLLLGNRFPATCKLERFAEAEGQLLSLLVFLILGAELLPAALPHLGWGALGYALLSLTAVRLLPVALALVGKELRWETVLFLGWFGPRGVASLLFALLVVGEAPAGVHEGLLHLVVGTVLLSVLAHGATAAPLARRYGRRLADGELAEHREVAAMPLRTRSG